MISIGLYGALIVQRWNESEIYQEKGLGYQRDEVLLIADYYETEVRYLVQQFMAPFSEGFDPVPDSFTVNHYFSQQHEWNYQINATSTSPVNDLFRLRLRLINAAAASVFNFSIANQTLPFTVIEVDGIPIQPVTVSMIRIQSAQRFSVIIDFSRWINRFQEDLKLVRIPFSIYLNPQYYPQ